MVLTNVKLAINVMFDSFAIISSDSLTPTSVMVGDWRSMCEKGLPTVESSSDASTSAFGIGSGRPKRIKLPSRKATRSRQKEPLLVSGGDQ